MSLPRTVAEVLRDHVTLSVEGIDRMYLNVYVPRLQCEKGIFYFFRLHRKQRVVSSVLMDPITKAFVAGIEAFGKKGGVPLITFEKKQRKDDIALERHAAFTKPEGVVFIGKAQEKTSVVRTEKRRDAKGVLYPWLVRSTAPVNHYYFYCLDRDFGPFFLKFCSYFPYNAKLCINGHEYVKRQLAKEGIPFEPLDNGIRSCSDPKRLQQICDDLSPEKIDALLRKWLSLLPQPLTPQDRAAGYDYDVSILQAEFSLTQVLDRPVTGRILFEEVIRENLDIGRPDQVQLIFNRKITRRTPGRFRTRVLTDGVVPSLHVDYKSSRIKQYHKENQALRTETTINNTRDFGIGKRLKNLPELRKIGFTANRRLLDVQRISHDCTIGEDVFTKLQSPCEVGDQHVPAMRFGDRRVQAALSGIVLFCFAARGFSNRDLRARLAPLLGKKPGEITAGQMTYDLRRLRLRGLIARIPKTHRYCLTQLGLRVALFYTRAHARLIRTGLTAAMPTSELSPTLAAGFRKIEQGMDELHAAAKVAS
jgi:hypothetical protein